MILNFGEPRLVKRALYESEVPRFAELVSARGGRTYYECHDYDLRIIPGDGFSVTATPESPVVATSALPPPQANTFPANGWKIRVCCTIRGATLHKNLPRTLPEHGSPAEWTVPGNVHVWFRESLMAAGIPFRAVEHLTAERAGVTAAAECLMEHLPMTAEEIEACR